MGVTSPEMTDIPRRSCVMVAQCNIRRAMVVLVKVSGWSSSLGGTRPTLPALQLRHLPLPAFFSGVFQASASVVTRLGQSKH